MALARKRATERRINELAYANEELDHDIGHLEETLALCKKVKSDGHQKGTRQNGAGGSIWQYGREGKLRYYKGKDDLENIHASRKTRVLSGKKVQRGGLPTKIGTDQNVPGEDNSDFLENGAEIPCKEMAEQEASSANQIVKSRGSLKDKQGEPKNKSSGIRINRRNSGSVPDAEKLKTSPQSLPETNSVEDVASKYPQKQQSQVSEKVVPGKSTTNTASKAAVTKSSVSPDSVALVPEGHQQVPTGGGTEFVLTGETSEEKISEMKAKVLQKAMRKMEIHERLKRYKSNRETVDKQKALNVSETRNTNNEEKLVPEINSGSQNSKMDRQGKDMGKQSNHDQRLADQDKSTSGKTDKHSVIYHGKSVSGSAVKQKTATKKKKVPTAKLR